MWGKGKEWKFHWQMLWVGLHLCPWKKMECSYPLLQWTRCQLIFHIVPMNWTKSMRRQGRILHSSFWCITFWLDGLVTEGSFHKSSTHTGTTRRIYLLRMDLQQRVWDFSSLPPFKGKPWNKSMKDTKALENACWRPGSQYFGLELVMTSARQWKSVEFASQLPELPSLLETSVKFHPMHGIHWDPTCSTGTKWTFLWLVITLQNSWLWGKFQILLHIWWSRNWEWSSQNLDVHSYSRVTIAHATVPGSSTTSCNSTRFTTSQAATSPKNNGFAEALMGISKKLMEKSIKDGKPWNYGLLQYRVTPISSTTLSPLEVLTSRRLRTSLPQIPSSIGKSMENSRIWQELIKCQPAGTSTSNNMELKPGQPVFMKKVHGNVWKTGVIDQPAKESDFYWIEFPDSSILIRAHYNHL